MEQRISVEDYAELSGVVAEINESLQEEFGDGDVMVLPGGGADRLIEMLTCYKCGKVVCPRHNRGLRPRRNDIMMKVPLDEENWTPYFPRRIAERLARELKVVVE